MWKRPRNFEVIPGKEEECSERESGVMRTCILRSFTGDKKTGGNMWENCSQSAIHPDKGADPMKKNVYQWSG